MAAARQVIRLPGIDIKAQIDMERLLNPFSSVNRTMQNGKTLRLVKHTCGVNAVCPNIEKQVL